MLNNAITFTLNEVAAVLGLITAGAAVWGIGMKIYLWAKKPNAEQNKEIAGLKKENEEIRKRLDEHEKFFATDKKMISSIKEENHLVMESLFALLQHGIDGNNIEPMKRAQKNIQDYLINK